MRNIRTTLRNHNTDTQGESFSQAVVAAVWRKGYPIENYSPNIWRHDKCGNVMKFSMHGNTDSEHGWEIDHILPVAKKGSDHLNNLQPLQWENNRRKADVYPWNCN